MSRPSDHFLKPLTAGALALPNRVVMAPLTRSRALDGSVPTPSATLYYAQRASAGLIVSEGVCISRSAVGSPGVPGIWSDEQIAAWRTITDAVHAQGGQIVAQLWHFGRAAHPEMLPDGAQPVGPSAVRIDGTTYLSRGFVPHVEPRALAVDEIAAIVGDYAAGARNAREAGFDGVELHGANGYLIDQFLHASSNRRTDEYGGDFAGRTRLLREVTQALCDAWEPGRVGVRLSPTSKFQDMHDPDLYGLFGAAVQTLAPLSLAYLHVVEPGISGAESTGETRDPLDSAWIRTRWSGTLIATGDYDRDTAIGALERGDVDAVGFGRLFLANPDLPRRLADGAALNEPDRETFYGGGDEGYVDYPSLEAQAQLADLRARLAADGPDALPAGPSLDAQTAPDEWPLAWALDQLRRERRESAGALASAQ